MERLFSPEGFDEHRGRAALPATAAADRRCHRRSGRLAPGDSLPPERDMAAMTGLSRVTVRKAVQALVASGQLVQRRGSGTFVAPKVERLEQALSLLTSFTEDMARRGRSRWNSVWLSRALHAPAPEEVMALGLGAGDRVARLERVRRSATACRWRSSARRSPRPFLPDPEVVAASLYAVLETRGLRPVRAVQRISAANLGPRDAEPSGRCPRRGGTADRADRLPALGPGGRIHPLDLSRRRL